jgi:hypothetical protein
MKLYSILFFILMLQGCSTMSDFTNREQMDAAVFRASYSSNDQEVQEYKKTLDPITKNNIQLACNNGEYPDWFCKYDAKSYYQVEK